MIRRLPLAVPVLAVAGLLGLAGPSSAGETLLILHKVAESLGFYDAATGRSQTVVPVGTVPHEMVLSKNRKLLYVTNYGVTTYTLNNEGGHTVSIVDVRRREKIGEIDLGAFRRPHGIERGASGRLYVTVDTPGSLLVIDPVARKILAAHDVGQAKPHMVQVSADETMAWTANAAAGTVTALHLAAPTPAKVIPVGGVPMGLALAGDGVRLYVATRGGNEVVGIDTATGTVVERLSIPGAPARLHFTKDGRQLLVSLFDSGEVAVIDLHERAEIRRFKVGPAAEGMGTDALGRFGYVSAQGENKVVQFSLKDSKIGLTIETAARPDPIIVLEGR